MDQPHARLAAALQAEILGLERLVAVLQDEQSALTGAHIDRLGEILPLKTQLVTELEAATDERRLAMQKAGVSEQEMAHHFQNQTLGTTWQKLLQLASSASQYNRSNGQLIQSREEAQRAFLNSITVQHDTGAYSADGRVTSSSLRRPLDQA